jgi:O-antigen/teichoic acid export membrane protein
VAAPAARFYDEPMLAQLLPVAALSIVLQGFMSTKEATANKDIRLGRLMLLGLFARTLGIALNIVLALILNSVWALVFGTLLQYFIKMILTHTVLPGVRNRLAWNWEVFWDLFHFGKYIMLGTAATFLIKQGDKAVLGKMVSLTDLAVYSIGWMIAAVAMTFNRVFGRRILFPLYAEKRVEENMENRAKVARLRFGVTGTMLLASFLLALVGDWLIQVLYTPDYYLAGPILVLVALASMPTIITAAYTEFLLSTGNSRSFTVILISNAVLQMVFLMIGVQAFGLFGAIIAPPLAVLLVYPMTVWMVRPYGVWDPRHDGLYALLAAVAWGVALSVHSDAIARVIAGAS